VAAVPPVVTRRGARPHALPLLLDPSYLDEWQIVINGYTM
jgi:hypothetical protein